jgi:hypothetical protein
MKIEQERESTMKLCSFIIFCVYCFDVVLLFDPCCFELCHTHITYYMLHITYYITQTTKIHFKPMAMII